MAIPTSRHEGQALHLAPTSSSAKADDPVFRAVSVQFGVTAYWMPAGACRRARRRRDPMAGMTALAISTSLRAYQESCALHQPMQPAAPWSGPLPASADIRRDLFRVLPVRRQG